MDTALSSLVIKRRGKLGSAPSHLPGNCGNRCTPGWSRRDAPCPSQWSWTTCGTHGREGSSGVLTRLPCHAAAGHTTPSTAASGCRYPRLSLPLAPCLGSASGLSHLKPHLILDSTAGYLPADSSSPRAPPALPSLLAMPPRTGCCRSPGLCPRLLLPHHLPPHGVSPSQGRLPVPRGLVLPALPSRVGSWWHGPAPTLCHPCRSIAPQQRRERAARCGVSSQNCSAQGLGVFFHHTTYHPICRDLLGKRAPARQAAWKARCRPGPCRPGAGPAGMPAARPAHFPRRCDSVLCTAPNSAGPWAAAADLATPHAGF